MIERILPQIVAQKIKYLKVAVYVLSEYSGGCSGLGYAN